MSPPRVHSSFPSFCISASLHLLLHFKNSVLPSSNFVTHLPLSLSKSSPLSLVIALPPFFFHCNHRRAHTLSPLYQFFFFFRFFFLLNHPLPFFSFRDFVFSFSCFHSSHGSSLNLSHFHLLLFVLSLISSFLSFFPIRISARLLSLDSCLSSTLTIGISSFPSASVPLTFSIICLHFRSALTSYPHSSPKPLSLSYSHSSHSTISLSPIYILAISLLISRFLSSFRALSLLPSLPLHLPASLRRSFFSTPSCSFFLVHSLLYSHNPAPNLSLLPLSSAASSKSVNDHSHTLRGPARISRLYLRSIPQSLSSPPTIPFLSPHFRHGQSLPSCFRCYSQPRLLSQFLLLSCILFITLVIPVLPSTSLSPVSVDFNSAIFLPLDFLISPICSHFQSRFKSFLPSPLFVPHGLFTSPLHSSFSLSISHLAISLTLRSWSKAFNRVFFSPFYLDFSPSSLYSSATFISSIFLFSTLLWKIVNIFSFYLNPRYLLSSLIHALSLLTLLFIYFTTLSIYFP